MIDTVTLISSSGHKIPVVRSVANMAEIVADHGGDEVPLVHIPTHIMYMLVSYCTYHSVEHTDEEIQEWNASFIDESPEILHQLSMASNSIGLQSLLDLLSKHGY